MVGGGGSDVKMGCTIYWKIFPEKKGQGCPLSLSFISYPLGLPMYNVYLINYYLPNNKLLYLFLFFIYKPFFFHGMTLECVFVT